MTAKQYYKQTSDMAYPLDNVHVEEDDRIVANIGPSSVKDADDALRILSENDFFSIPRTVDLDEVDTDNITFEIRFHYGVDCFDCFEIRVCDIIDCRVVDDGRFVLSCNGYKLIKSYRPRKENDGKAEAADKKEDVPAPRTERKSIFDLFDDIVGCSSCLKDLFTFPNFPRFPDISKMIEDTRKNIEDGIEGHKGDGDSRFYNFSCRIDPDGKVHIKRSSNKGTVEKEFMIGDGKPSSSSSSSSSSSEKSDPKTELRNLVK